MSTSYFLRSARLGFRHWSDDDLDLAIALWENPVVARLLCGVGDRVLARARYEREVATMRDLGFQYWPIFLLDGGTHVGCCGLRPRTTDSQALELGSHLHPEFWGMGLAVEASRVVIGHAFSALGVEAIFAGHHPQNHASCRALEKLGFRYTHDEYFPETGLDHPSYLLEAKAWQTGPGRREGWRA